MYPAWKTLLFTTCFSLFCCASQMARAEGGDASEGAVIERSTGNNGVNRRVITRPGYAEVEGTFNMTFQLPKVGNSAGGVEPSLGPYGDRPSPYLGGGGIYVGGSTVEVDAGLQYDQIVDPDGIVRGWVYFLRNTNPDNNGNGLAQYNNPRYWSAASSSSKAWRSGTTDHLDGAYLKYTIYQGNDPSTPATEQPGWFSLTMNKMHDATDATGAAIPDSNRTVYWTHPPIASKVRTAIAAGVTTNRIELQNVIGLEVGGTLVIGTGTRIITAVTRTTTRNAVTNALNVWGTITVDSNFTGPYVVEQIIQYRPPNNTATISTTVQSGGLAGTQSVVVASAVGLEKQPLQVGTEVKNVQSIDPATGTITVTTPFISNHTPGENVTQTLNRGQAYPNHPVAPWQGTVIFAPARLNETRVKRVVAMTRTTGYRYELDGSWLKCTFSGGRVRKVGEAAGGHSWGAGYPTGGGDVLDVDQGSSSDPSTDIRFTAYDVPRNRAGTDPSEYSVVAAWDRQWPLGIDKVPTSETIVKFPSLNINNIEARRNTQASWRATEDGNSRYTRETVHIYLRTATRLQGEFVQR